MNQRNICKGCSDSVIVTEGAIRELLDEIEKDVELLVSDEVYQARLSACKSCDSLQYGTTCAHSGCMVSYRAKFKNKSCPQAGNPKWHKVS